MKRIILTSLIALALVGCARKDYSPEEEHRESCLRDMHGFRGGIENAIRHRDAISKSFDQCVKTTTSIELAARDVDDAIESCENAAYNKYQATHRGMVDENYINSYDRMVKSVATCGVDYK